MKKRHAALQPPRRGVELAAPSRIGEGHHGANTRTHQPTPSAGLLEGDGRARRHTIHRSEHQALPGVTSVLIAQRGRALMRLLRGAWREYQQDYAKYFAGAMVYYALVSLVPILLLVL